MRDVLRLKHCSIRTEEAYGSRIKRYILFLDKRHLAEMGGPEIEAFLTHSAMDQKAAASAQNQTLSALLLLYSEILEKDPNGHTIDVVRARQPKRLPTALAHPLLHRGGANSTKVWNGHSYSLRKPFEGYRNKSSAKTQPN